MIIYTNNIMYEILFLFFEIKSNRSIQDTLWALCILIICLSFITFTVILVCKGILGQAQRYPYSNGRSIHIYERPAISSAT